MITQAYKLVTVTECAGGFWTIELSVTSYAVAYPAFKDSICHIVILI